MIANCKFANASYCPVHDYDHLLEREWDNTPPQMFAVPRQAITVHDGKMAIEASDAGLPVGLFPETLIVPRRAGGSNVHFQKAFTHVNRENEIEKVLYVNETYGDLVVLND